MNYSFKIYSAISYFHFFCASVLPNKNEFSFRYFKFNACVTGSIRHRVEVWPGEINQEHAQDNDNSLTPQPRHHLAHVFAPVVQT